MAEIVILGSAAALPGEGMENASFAIVSQTSLILIDCPCNPIVRLEQAHILFDSLRDVIVTHAHPDHMGAIPMLLMGLWLKGRRSGLTIHGLAYTLDRLETILNAFDWRTWPGMFPVRFHRLDEEPDHLVLATREVTVDYCINQHLIPNIAVRFEISSCHKVAVYSSDTEPCAAVEQLARNCDVLLHEAAGEGLGHSSPSQAGALAKRARARKLYLIHYPYNCNQRVWLNEAQSIYPGPVALVSDLTRIPLD